MPEGKKILNCQNRKKIFFSDKELLADERYKRTFSSITNHLEDMKRFVFLVIKFLWGLIDRKPEILESFTDTAKLTKMVYTPLCTITL